MTLKRSFLKKAVLWALAFHLAGFTSPLFISKAHALFWEDESDSNDPKETQKRPEHFFLFDWINGLNRDSKVGHYRDMDDHDKGPAVNGGAKTLVVVASGLVGLGTGIFLGNKFTGANEDPTAGMFVGGALGLCAGVAVGVLIMPRDYEFDRNAKIDYMKQRQAWLQDPVRRQIAQSFRPSQVTFSLKF
jgi:hypothetical protein